MALSLVINVPTGGGVIYAGASVRFESTKIPKIALHAQIISLLSTSKGKWRKLTETPFMSLPAVTNVNVNGMLLMPEPFRAVFG